jgi:hypothetical protein
MRIFGVLVGGSNTGVLEAFCDNVRTFDSFIDPEAMRDMFSVL